MAFLVLQALSTLECLPENFEAIQLPLLPYLRLAMNFDSMVDHAMHVCLKDFHDIVVPPKVNIYPLVDLDSKLSKIQLTSLNPSIINGYLM